MLETPKPQLQLRNYTGPLDLLLSLIEQQRLDVTAISLAQVAEQYMAAVASLHTPSPAAIAEFLVIGAKLLVIKTRALLPRPPVELAPRVEQDVGDELARQLAEYRRFKMAAAQLREWDQAGQQTYARQASKIEELIPQRPLPPVEQLAKLDVSVADLVETMQRRLQLVLPLEAKVVPLPTPKIITIADVRARICAVLSRQAWATFEDLLSLALTRNEVIVTLWTVLELFKRQQVVIEQSELYGTISIGRGPVWSGADTQANQGDDD